MGSQDTSNNKGSLARGDYLVVLAALSILWLIAIPIFAQRINTMGAYATSSSASALAVVSAKYKNNPGSLRLSDSYQVWARNMSGMDMADYVEAAMVFAQGKGLFIKNGMGFGPPYIPFCYHPPLTPFVIGTVIRLCGEKSVFPYFLLMCNFHFISAVTTVLLAGNLVKTRLGLMLAGLLSLFCWPALEYIFGAGLFSSEAVINPFFGMSLLALAAYRKRTWREAASTAIAAKESFVTAGKAVAPYALLGALFGACITVAAYARDQFGGFATFAAVVITGKTLFKRKHVLKGLTFALVAIFVLHALEAPWEKRNQKYLGQRVMSIISWNYYVLWGWCIWPEPEVLTQSDDDCCVGVGTFINPQMQPLVAAALKKDMQAGALFAAKAYVTSVLQHPYEAFKFRAKYYDCLWFGHRKEVLIYLWCVISAAFFATFVFFNRRRFYPELFIFPAYMLVISSLIQYDPRFCFAFYVFITPVCVASVCESLLKRRPIKLPDQAP